MKKSVQHNNLSDAQWPVVIVGAGPVGLLVANFLGLQNIPCLLAEKRIDRAAWSKAIGITPPSLEIMRICGLHTQVLNNAVRVKKAIIHDDRGLAGSVNFDKLDSPFQFILSHPQSLTTDVFEHSLTQYRSVTYQKGLELEGIRREKGHVKLSFHDACSGKAIQNTAGYVIGCDGSDSTVRCLAGIPFQRSSYGRHFVMGDYEDATDWGGEAHVFFTQDGSLESFPLPGAQRRWVSMVVQCQNGSPEDNYLGERVEQFCGRHLALKRTSPVFSFTPEKIIVSRAACNRIILAGDAAHVISPIGGHGMNTGFGDAAQLAVIIPQLLKNGLQYSGHLIDLYNVRRLRAAAAARRRAAVGMWVGTRTGKFVSSLRGFLFRRLVKPPVDEMIASHFAMLSMPHSRINISRLYTEQVGGYTDD